MTYESELDRPDPYLGLMTRRRDGKSPCAVSSSSVVYGARRLFFMTVTRLSVHSVQFVP